MAKIDPNTPVTIGYLNEAIQTVLDAMDQMQREIAEQFRIQNSIWDTRFATLQKDVQQTKEDIHQAKKDIRDLKTKLMD